MTTNPHKTVLLEEAVDALLIDDAGTYVDCTYGRGGHSQAIVDRLSDKGRLVVLDRDQDAIDDANNRFGGDHRVVIEHGPFSDLKNIVSKNGLPPLSGVLLDLGVSSPQLDNGVRGFSFMQSGPLDMRMDQTSGETAAEWLAYAPEQDIVDVLKRYGEERFAKRIARSIVETRADTPILTTAELAALIEQAVPFREKHKHPATRSFQAIRIQVNHELQELEQLLDDVVELLCSGGRLVVISFHSLEDRIVKRFFKKMAQGEELPSRLPIRDADIHRDFKLLGRVKPSDQEVNENRRSRSSVMRIAEKL
ncbi:MAG: 16S rRNA (cytosine1402-N4)-methyltransferase [Candidatus Azotimanducaceae bacterium]|jgi:16S rRNA (cytosine1402-N4)-methyltransferase